MEDRKERLLGINFLAGRYSSVLTLQVGLHNEQCKQHVAVPCCHHILPGAVRLAHRRLRINPTSRAGPTHESSILLGIPPLSTVSLLSIATALA